MQARPGFYAGQLGFVAIGKKKSVLQSSPHEDWNFFPGKNPDLGAGLAGCRLRCRAGGAAGRLCQAGTNLTVSGFLAICAICASKPEVLYSTYSTDFARAEYSQRPLPPAHPGGRR